MNRNLPDLIIAIEQKKYIRSESIPAKVSLINNTSRMVIINNLTLPNNPLTFKATNDLGDHFKGTLRSELNRNGETTRPLKDGGVKKLEKGATMTIDVDLIAILRELPEGNYKLKASYWLGGINYSYSNILEFTVIASKTINSSTYLDYSRNDIMPIRTSWINKDENGNSLFLMLTSHNNPMSILSNKRICKVEEDKTTAPSLLASLEQATEHILIYGNDSLEIIMSMGGDVKRVWKGHYDEKPILPAITTEDGELRFVSASIKDGITTIYITRVLPNGEMKIIPVHETSSRFEINSACCDAQCNFHIAYVINNAIEYIKIAIEGNSVVSKLSLIAENNNTVLNVHLYNGLGENNDDAQIGLSYTIKNEDELASFFVNCKDGKHLNHTYIPLEGMNLRLLQVILDYQYRPYFLFSDAQGVLWFKCYDGAFVCASGVDGDLKENFQPIMLISWKYSRRYGIYLRYIKGGIFEYRALKNIVET